MGFFFASLAILGAVVGVVASVTIVGVCIAYSGSWWPLTVLLILASVAWFIPWEILKERRRNRRFPS